MHSHTNGGLQVSVEFLTHDAYGRAKYRVLCVDTLKGAELFRSDELSLPWRDDRRALRDAAGFLAYYASDGDPDEHTGVTREQLDVLHEYDDLLSMIELDLTEGLPT